MKSPQIIFIALLLVLGMTACQQYYTHYHKKVSKSSLLGEMTTASLLTSKEEIPDSCLSSPTSMSSIADTSTILCLQTDSLIEVEDEIEEKALVISDNSIFKQILFDDSECVLFEDIKDSQEELSKALKQQKRQLRRQSKSKEYNFDGIKRSNLELRIAIDELQEWLKKEDAADSLAFCEMFETYQLKGKNGRGRVRMTAYYTPVIEASRTWSKTFQYPIYRKPDSWPGKLPTRQEIDGEMKLIGRDLEVAWTKSLLDNYFMNLQGSAYMEYQDSVRQLLIYHGQNGHPYRGVQSYILSQRHVSSVGIDMQNVKEWFKENPDSIRPILFRNPSYTFFKKTEKAPTGAAGVALTAKHSVAVDTRYIPYGCLLLAKIPKRGRGKKAEWRILVPQDKGGAIRGDAHIDVYCGVGESAVKEARNLKEYGEVWLLLPKSAKPAL
ncbi:MAG: MltA domain-containing protein [Chitinophagales bacterium]